MNAKCFRASLPPRARPVAAIFCAAAIGGVVLLSAPSADAQDEGSAAAAPAPPPAPRQSIDQRIEGIWRDLKTARAEDPPNPRSLEAVCAAWQPRRVFEKEPTLKAELAICAARAAYLAERDNVLQRRLDEALALTAGDANTAAEVDLQARARLLRAEISRAAFEKFERCGTGLGLERLRKFEAEEMRRRLDLAVSHYRSVLGIGAPKAELEAIASIARMYDQFYRRAALKKPSTYRGVELPAPLTFFEIRTDNTLGESLAPSTSPWPREIRRLYSVAVDNAKAQGNTALAIQLAKERDALAQDSALQQEAATAPWKDAIPAGAIRVFRGQYQAFDGKAWKAVAKPKALARLKTQAKARPFDVAGAFALVALAHAGQVQPVDVIAAAKSKNATVRFAAFNAMQLAPVTEYKQPLIAAWTAAQERRPKQKDGTVAPLFSTLQSAMYGEPERVFLALKSLVTRERDVALDLTYTRALPLEERAWLIAELGDTRTRYRVIELVQTGDALTQAISLYGTYLSNGERALYMLRQYRSGASGCVARNTLGIHEERERRLAGVPVESGGE